MGTCHCDAGILDRITCTKLRLTALKPPALACFGSRLRPGFCQAVGPQSRAEAGAFGPSRAVDITSQMSSARPIRWSFRAGEGGDGGDGGDGDGGVHSDGLGHHVCQE